MSHFVGFLEGSFSIEFLVIRWHFIPLGSGGILVENQASDPEGLWPIP